MQINTINKNQVKFNIYQGFPNWAITEIKGAMGMKVGP